MMMKMAEYITFPLNQANKTNIWRTLPLRVRRGTKDQTRSQTLLMEVN